MDFLSLIIFILLCLLIFYSTRTITMLMFYIKLICAITDYNNRKWKRGETLDTVELQSQIDTIMKYGYWIMFFQMWKSPGSFYSQKDYRQMIGRSYL